MSALNLLEYLLGAPMKDRSQDFLGAGLALLALFFSVFFISGKNGLLAKIKKANRQAELINKFPGPKTYPFLGTIPNVYQLALTPSSSVLPWTLTMAKKYGPIFRIWMPGQPKIMICCSETAVVRHLKETPIKTLQNDSFRAKPLDVIKVARAIGGEGLLTLTPDVHGPRKKMWLQALTKKHIDGSIRKFRQEGARLCSFLEQFEGTGKDFNMVDHAIHCTFQTIANSAFGEEYMNNLPESVGREHIHLLHTVALNMMERVFRPWLNSDWLYFNCTEKGRETRKCVQRGNELMQLAIDDRILLRKNETDRKKEKLPCFLDHLLDLQEQGLLTEKQVLQELNVFIVAGYDTTGLTISYVLYMLSLNPEHQTKVVEELVEIFGDSLDDFSDFTPVHIKEMRYLEMCIKETLRIYPTAPYGVRRSTHEVTLPDGRIIPEDVDVYIAFHYIHQDPKYFPEPEKFIPTRHLVPIPALMPFSMGSRNCIGQVYAMQAMKMILAQLLMKYRWETTEKSVIQPLAAGPVIVPENGLHFKIYKRFSKEN